MATRKARQHLAYLRGETDFLPSPPPRQVLDATMQESWGIAFCYMALGLFCKDKWPPSETLDLARLAEATRLVAADRAEEAQKAVVAPLPRADVIQLI